MKKKNRKKWIWSLSVLALALFGVVLYQVENAKHSRITYRITKVMRGDVKATILSTGVVAPQNRLDLKPPIAGRVEQILVEEGQTVKRHQILAWISSTERATLVDTASSRGAEDLKYWEDSYKMTPILAPGDGLIILKNADAGQTVTQTDIVLSMSDHLMVKASVDETDLALVKNGQNVQLILDAFPNDALPAKVIHIGYDAKTVNNVTTYEVDVIATERPRFMKSGMTANVTFLISEKDDALLVPAASIRTERHKSFVMIPNPANPSEPQQKEVRVGISDGKKVEILEGLQDGETVLTAAVRAVAEKGEHSNSSPFSPVGGGGRPPR